jgi:hypothetical protein
MSARTRADLILQKDPHGRLGGRDQSAQASSVDELTLDRAFSPSPPTVLSWSGGSSLRRYTLDPTVDHSYS